MRALMSAALAGAVDDRGVLLLDDDLLGLAEIVQRRLLERQADFIGDHRAAGQDRDVLQHGLATIAEARGLDGRDLDDAADVVHDERRERFAFDVFGDDQQRTAGLRDAFEQRQHLADVRDLLVVQQDVRASRARTVWFCLVVDEVRREVAAVELHALDDVELVLQARAFFDRDHAFLADLLHRVGDGLADRLVGVRGDRADLRDRLVVLAGLRQSFLSSSTAAMTALSMPRFRSIGLAPAATAFRPSRMIAWASTVAVVVPSPASSEVLEATSFTICAPMFSNLSLSSISFATDTPSLVTVGAPKLFSSTALRPFGPSVALTALARMLTPLEHASRGRHR